MAVRTHGPEAPLKGPHHFELAVELVSRAEWAAIARKRGLNSREVELLKLMLRGKSYQEAAVPMRVRHRTVKMYAARVQRNLVARGPAQVILRVMEIQRQLNNAGE